MKLLNIILLSIIFILACQAQVTINGTLSDKNGFPIENANVLINKVGTDSILAYSISNSAGHYSVKFNSNQPEVDLQIRSLGFAPINKKIINQTQTLHFTLNEDSVKLKEVVIKSPPISRRGDTINYSVSAFSKEQDRSISDVLKRLPGIEVLENGKIIYQGKPINKYYIEGLDLLDGKYNIANKNLPHNEISRIQILENHQPIKILDSLVFSESAALNIKLKNKYTLTGQAELASGASPLLWEANITPMLFSKKQQMLNSYQSNNIGENLATQNETLTLEALLEQFENNSEKRDWLSIQQLSTPNFSEKRWLDNNAHLLSGNYLRKLKNDYELRLNVSYLNDIQQQRGSSQTLFFTTTDTISLVENTQNKLFINTLETNLNIEKNTNKNYLKNNLRFQGFWDNQQGNIQLQNSNLNQNLENKYFKINNSLKTIFPFAKQLVSINSYSGYQHYPQTLEIRPGQYDELINNENPYERLNQEVDLKTFYTNNYIGFTKGLNKFSLSPKLGFQIEKQQLNSHLSTSENQVLSNNFNNNLNWFRSKLYFNLQTQYKLENLRLLFTTPLNIHSYQLEDSPLQEEDNLNAITFEPRLSFIYDDNGYWKFNTTGSIRNQFGDINQLHYAYILKNYRNIVRVNTPIPQTISKTFSTGISYRNPIKSIFLNINYSHIKSTNNLLYSNQIFENGAIELQALEQDNDRVNRTISARFGKYLSDINSNLSFNTSFNVQDFQQILNTEITDINNQNLTLGGKIESDITNWLNFEYQPNWLFSKNRLDNTSNNTITQQSHTLNINFYPKENQYFALKTEYIKNDLFSESTQNFFADIIYRYTFGNRNIDFEIQLNNIFNIDNFRTVNIGDFSYIETTFNLRPRQFLFKVRFPL